MKIQRTTQKAGLIAALLLLFFTAPTLAAVGDPLPKFSLQGPDGTVYTNDTFKGKVLLIFMLGHN